MLIEYIFLHFGPTRSVYEFRIFTYEPICPSLSLHCPAPVRHGAPLGTLAATRVDLGVPTAPDAGLQACSRLTARFCGFIGDWFSQSSMSWPWLANCPLHASEQRRIGEYNAATAPSLVALCRQAAVTCPGLLFCSSTTRCPRALTTGLPSRSTSLPA